MGEVREHSAKDLLLYIARSLVENPDAVTVTEVEGAQELTLELRVAPTTWARLLAARAVLPRKSGPWSAPAPSAPAQRFLSIL